MWGFRVAIRPLANVVLMLLLGACSPTTVLNAIAPREGVSVTHDLAYADGPRHTLDVYTPRPPTILAPISSPTPTLISTSTPTPASTPTAVVVFFYGGNWEAGSKDMYRFVGAALASRGVMTVIPDYRLYPEVRFPAFMNDAAAAVAWTHANAARFGGDPHRLFLMGHSAGAQIATLLALDGSYLRADGLSPQSDVCGVIGLAGPYDFLPLHSATLKAIFGPEAEWPRSQPINFVSPQAPAMLLLAGRDDDIVDPGNTLRLAASLRAAGTSVEDELYRGVGHKTLIAAFSGPLTFLAPVREAALRFVAAHGACGG
jgi:acetyl esterase/lipase